MPSTPPPAPELLLPPTAGRAVQPAGGAGIAIVSFNTARQTLRCLASLAQATTPPEWISVLDNGSRDEDYATLVRGCAAFAHSELRLYRSGANLGFAEGCNVLIDALLANPDCRWVVLLNNDAVAQPELVQRLVGAVTRDPEGTGLAGGRMNRLSDPESADTLGITLYASLMPANRHDTGDPYLGPTGGCCLVTRELVGRLKEASGYCFDSRYFCYCEDTDLALRAVLLGYRPAYVDDLVALHEGQASSGVDSAFIAYHGLRNLIWMHAKLVPGALLLKYGALLALAHALTLVRQVLSGNAGVMWRVYRDALRGLPAFWRERRDIAARGTRISWRDLDRVIAARFYRKGYLGEVLGQIGRRFGVIR